MEAGTDKCGLTTMTRKKKRGLPGTALLDESRRQVTGRPDDGNQCMCTHQTTEAQLAIKIPVYYAYSDEMASCASADTTGFDGHIFDKKQVRFRCTRIIYKQFAHQLFN